jgi:hypothetical protein
MSSGKGSSDRRSRKKGPSLAMDGYRIAYKPLADSTPEVEVQVLAAVYSFLLDRRERRDDDIAADSAEEQASMASNGAMSAANGQRAGCYRARAPPQ